MIGVAVLGLLVASTLPAHAAPGPRGEAILGKDGARVSAALIVDAARVAPGEHVRIGVLLRLEPGWHVYWQNPGDAGAATELTWRAPGSEIGPIQWPAPRVFREAEGALTTFGYEDDVLLVSPAVVAMNATESWDLEVDVGFVACKIECIPGHIQLADAIPVDVTCSPAEAEIRERFNLAASRLPRTPETLEVAVEARASQSAAVAGDDFALVLEITSCHERGRDCRPWTLDATYSSEAFIPTEKSDMRLTALGLSHAPTAATDSGRGFSLVSSAHAFEDEPQLAGQRLRGVVPLARADGDAHLVVDVPITLDPKGGSSAAFEVIAALRSAPDEGEHAKTAGPRRATPTLALALVLALLGGLILNLMPCVLPILAIKIFAITDLARAERGHVVRHGMAYLAGVVASMWALAAVVVALRAAGAAVGWGFQLQDPIFLAAICTILVVFALNLFGAFEITLQPPGPDLGHSAGPSHPSRSFFEGTLAVALATPCTAPFLGTAVGFAFASSGLVIFCVFTAIGVGLAAPFVLVALVPGWARFVPRPGPWMLRVRQALAFALLATVAWLAWVAGRALGVDAQSLLIAYLLVVALLAWTFGIAQAVARPGLSRGLAGATLAFVVAALAVAPSDPSPGVESSGRVAASPDGIPWAAFDPAAIANERAAGRPVFVEFTADWCITCKVNEAVVLSQAAVRDELEKWGYASFKADWTRRDDAITLELAEWGRAGVPMYVVYPADPGKAAVLLPELLTLDATLEALREAGRGKGVRMTATGPMLRKPQMEEDSG
jgi:thiol:disulfide interchange protein/DsbC/DsbD-like thiol-disulfide interchange protein